MTPIYTYPSWFPVVYRKKATALVQLVRRNAVTLIPEPGVKWALSATTSPLRLSYRMAGMSTGGTVGVLPLLRSLEDGKTTALLVGSRPIKYDDL